MFISKSEAKAKGLKHYFVGKPCKYGHIEPRYLNGNCSRCLKDRAKTDDAKAKRAVWYKKNIEKCAIENRRYRKNNRDKIKTYSKLDLIKNKLRRQMYGRLYKAKRVSATPPWVDHRELYEIYASRPPGYEVDHVVPLISDLVCGLNVPWNLEVIPAWENRAKGNRFQSNEWHFDRATSQFVRLMTGHDPSQTIER